MALAAAVALPRGLRWRRFRRQLSVQVCAQPAAGLDVERPVDRLVGHAAHDRSIARVAGAAPAAISPGDQPWSIHASIRRHNAGFSTSLNALGRRRRSRAARCATGAQ